MIGAKENILKKDPWQGWLGLGEIENNEFSKLVSIQNEIQNLPFFIDDTPALSVSQIASRARRLKRTEGLKLIVIDYIQ